MKSIDEIMLYDVSLRDYINICRNNLEGDPCIYLSDTDLSFCDLSNLDLSFANLCFVDLSYADLTGSNLSFSNFVNVEMKGCNFKDTNLSNVNSLGVVNNWHEAINLDVPMVCPEQGSFIAWKSCFAYTNGRTLPFPVFPVIVKLEIPSHAERSSAFSRKCRASEAKVLEFQNMEGETLNPDNLIVSSMSTLSKVERIYYEIDKTVKPTNGAFDKNRFNECSIGIHFFMTREEAVDYCRDMMR